MERRECFIWRDDGYCGYFHCWTYDGDKKALAVIEQFNGVIIYEKPEHVTFLDISPSGLRHFHEAKKKYTTDTTVNDSVRQLIIDEMSHICKLTEFECIKCKPGACESRKEKTNEQNDED